MEPDSSGPPVRCTTVTVNPCSGAVAITHHHATGASPSSATRAEGSWPARIHAAAVAPGACSPPCAVPMRNLVPCLGRPRQIPRGRIRSVGTTHPHRPGSVCFRTLGSGSPDGVCAAAKPGADDVDVAHLELDMDAPGGPAKAALWTGRDAMQLGFLQRMYDTPLFGVMSCSSGAVATVSNPPMVVVGQFVSVGPPAEDSVINALHVHREHMPGPKTFAADDVVTLITAEQRVAGAGGRVASVRVSAASRPGTSGARRVLLEEAAAVNDVAVRTHASGCRLVLAVLDAPAVVLALIAPFSSVATPDDLVVWRASIPVALPEPPPEAVLASGGGATRQCFFQFAAFSHDGVFAAASVSVAQTVVVWRLLWKTSGDEKGGEPPAVGRDATDVEGRPRDGLSEEEATLGSPSAGDEDAPPLSPSGDTPWTASPRLERHWEIRFAGDPAAPDKVRAATPSQPFQVVPCGPTGFAVTAGAAVVVLEPYSRALSARVPSPFSGDPDASTVPEIAASTALRGLDSETQHHRLVTATASSSFSIRSGFEASVTGTLARIAARHAVRMLRTAAASGAYSSHQHTTAHSSVSGAFTPMVDTALDHGARAPLMPTSRRSSRFFDSDRRVSGVPLHVAAFRGSHAGLPTDQAPVRSGLVSFGSRQSDDKPPGWSHSLTPAARSSIGFSVSVGDSKCRGPVSLHSSIGSRAIWASYGRLPRGMRSRRLQDTALMLAVGPARCVFYASCCPRGHTLELHVSAANPIGLFAGRIVPVACGRCGVVISSATSAVVPAAVVGACHVCHYVRCQDCATLAVDTPPVIAPDTMNADPSATIGATGSQVSFT